jgi:hypothetical protein
VKKSIILPAGTKRIKIYDVLAKVSEMASFEDYVDVYVQVEKDAQGQEVAVSGGKLVVKNRIGKADFEDVKLENFISFCRSSGVKPRNPNSPWVFDYDGHNAAHNIMCDITVDELRQFAKLFDVEVMEGVPLTEQDSAAKKAPSSPAERRAQLDIKHQRGSKRVIIEQWEAIESKFGPTPDGHQVLRHLKIHMDQADLPKLKTVQNHLAELRQRELIP